MIDIQYDIHLNYLVVVDNLGKIEFLYKSYWFSESNTEPQIITLNKNLDSNKYKAYIINVGQNGAFTNSFLIDSSKNIELRWITTQESGTSWVGFAKTSQISNLQLKSTILTGSFAGDCIQEVIGILY